MTLLERPENALIVSSLLGETRGALIRHGRLCEMMILRDNTMSRVGEIHRGRVSAVDQRIGACFVDLGANGQGFLGFEAGGDTVGEGDTILVRVERDGVDGKLPGLSRRIELGSRNLVLTLASSGIAVSRRIPDAAERFRLKGLLSSWCQPNEGWLARTAASGASEAQIIVEMDRLRSQMAGFELTGAPALLYVDAGPVERILRELSDPALTAIWLDDASAAKHARLYLDHWHREMAGLVSLMAQSGDLFARLGLEEEIEQALERRVVLANGGAIRFDVTPTLTAIDIDMGQAGLDPLRLNLSAIDEIARQVRLRDIGGAILIDFLRLRDRDARLKVQEAVVRAFACDRLPVQILGFTRGGLMEITRPRNRLGLARVLTAPCPSCQGEGLIANPLAQGLAALRQLLRHPTPHRVRLEMAPALITALERHAAPALASMSQHLGQALTLIPRADLMPDRFETIEEPPKSD